MSGSLRKLFEAEQHVEVLELSQSNLDQQDLSAVIGSLCAVGHLEIAEVLLGQSEVDQASESESLFYIAQGACLARNFSVSRKSIGRLRSLVVEGSSPFWFHLATAFYRYYTGNLKVALIHVFKAQELVKRDSATYTGLLVDDIAAQIHSCRGSYRAALLSYGRAIGAAVFFGRTNHAAGLSVLLSIHIVRRGPFRVDHAERITSMVRALGPGKRTLKASLLLEASRQWIKRSQVEKTRDTIAQAYDQVGENPLPRFHAAIACRYAELALYEGRTHEARLHLDLCRTLLDPAKDRIQVLELIAIEKKVWELLGNQERIKELSSSQRRLLRRTDSPLPEITEQKTNPVSDVSEQLNDRQLRVLSYLTQSQFINVPEYRRQFSVSDITACRDLSSLTKLGLLERVGKARATRYTLRPDAHVSH